MKRRRKQISRRHFGLQAISLCISTTMVLILLGLVVSFVLTTRNLSTYVKENMSMNIVLGDTVSTADGMALANSVKTRPYAREVRFISEEEALETMTREMGRNPIDVAGVNPFQAEIEIQLHAAYANSDSLLRIADALRKDSLVTDVYYAQEQIDAVDHNLNHINAGLLVLSALLLFICYTLISNSVELSVYARRFSIHTMKLVGARWSFIMRPFLVRSIIIGLVSSLLACAVLWGFGHTIHRYVPDIGQLLGWGEAAITATAIFVFGFVIMLLCTMLSVIKFLRMTAGELYKI